MPYGKSYANEEAPGVPMDQRRQAAKRVSYVNTKLQPRREGGAGKFAGGPEGPSGGSMNGGGKRRPGNKPPHGNYN